MAEKKIEVAVLAGGIGSEREVSLMSGKTIHDALARAGVDVFISDISPDVLSVLEDESVDVFFLALHGEFGEDGQVQAIMEERNLCFTGTDSRSSKLSFDKAASKKVLRQAQLTVADDICIYKKADREELFEKLSKIGDKFVVKPINEGSSVGVEIVEGAAAAVEASERCLEKFGECMIEKFIAGKEITVGVLEGQALPIIEIRSKEKFYDYKAKYLDDATEYLFGTVEDDEVVKRAQRDAVKCFEVLGCRHYGRVDMILTDEGVPYILEINTLPGFTSHSLLPMAAKKAGIPVEKLCMRIVEAALNSR